MWIVIGKIINKFLILVIVVTYTYKTSLPINNNKCSLKWNKEIIWMYIVEIIW